MTDLVLYHGSCVDGFTAAWVCWREFGDEAEYVAVNYGQDPPDVTGKDVLIVDFSYPREVLLRMHEQAKSLRVLDHHKTAREEFEGLDFCTFDMERSGAGLTMGLFTDGEYPWLVDYVEDRDLWRFALPKSKEVNAYIKTLPFDFEAYETAFILGIDNAALGGAGALAQVERYVREIAPNARWAEFDGHQVPVINAPHVNGSELLGHLAKGQPFALSWCQRQDGRYQYSLRSEEAGEDVGAIAKAHRGGGHRNAAGFVADVPFDALGEAG